jgi:hypothetical protein
MGMRLRVLFVLAALAALAALPAQSLAAQPSLTSERHAGDMSAMRALCARLGLTFPQRASHPQAPRAPLGSSFDVSGYVFDFNNNPVQNAEVDWSIDSSSSGGSATTDSSGFYDLGTIPPATGNGTLDMYLQDGVAQPYYFSLDPVSWGTPNPLIFEFRPGQLATQITRGGPWANRWSEVDVQLYGDAGSSTGTSTPYTDQTFFKDPPGSLTDPTNAMPGSYSTVTYNFVGDRFLPSEGLEVSLSPAAVVTAGVTSATSLTLNEATAMRTWVISSLPDCASGAPGVRVPVVLRNFPVGWVSQLWGASERGGIGQSYGTLTSKTTGSNVARLLVPALATPGYFYAFIVQHRAGALFLMTAYQVCTLKASKTSISRGAAIRLSGIVPTANPHTGNHPGIWKWVYLYQRVRPAGQPSNWAHPAGWAYVGKYKANIHGIYTTGLLKPTQTTYYVLKYPGDALYWKGFTSVTRVVVH